MARRILERFLPLARSSHFKCFLLLFHFVLNFTSPKYKGISNVTIKCIATSWSFFLLFPDFWTLCSVMLGAVYTPPKLHGNSQNAVQVDNSVWVKLYGFISHSFRARSFFAASGFSVSSSSMTAALICFVEMGGSILQSLA